MPQNEFQIGDVVRLNSGGPEMTVRETDVNWVYAVYWDKVKNDFSVLGPIDYAMLSKVEKNDQFVVE